MFMAGGGIRGGVSYGATDELGYNAVENVFHIHDLHATMLHCLGIDHKRLTFIPRPRLPPDGRVRSCGGGVDWMKQIGSLGSEISIS